MLQVYLIACYTSAVNITSDRFAKIGKPLMYLLRVFFMQAIGVTKFTRSEEWRCGFVTLLLSALKIDSLLLPSLVTRQ